MLHETYLKSSGESKNIIIYNNEVGSNFGCYGRGPNAITEKVIFSVTEP